jgi:hypothetical protein
MTLWPKENKTTKAIRECGVLSVKITTDEGGETFNKFKNTEKVLGRRCYGNQP